MAVRDALGVARAGEHRPALRDRIDLAFRRSRRPQRRAVIEIRATIPAAVPGVALDIRTQAAPPPAGSVRRTPRRRAPPPATANCSSTSYRKNASQTLSPLPWMPTRFMPSFQSPRTHQRQAVLAEPQAVQDGARAVLVEARRLVGATRQVVVRIFVGVHRAAFQEAHVFVQHAGVAGAGHIAAGRQRQPEIIVRTMRAHAAALGRVPPVLHVSFAKLARDAQRSRCSRSSRGSQWIERHRVLQLIAEAEGAARSGSSRCAPRDGRPASGRAASRWPAHSTTASGVSTLTAPSVCFQYCHTPSSAARAASDPAEAVGQLPGFLRVACPRPAMNTIWRSSPGASSNATWMAAHGSRPAPILPGQPRTRHRRRAAPACRCVPGTRVRSPVTVRAVSLAPKNATRPANSVLYGIAREDARLLSGSISVTTCMRILGCRSPSTHST